MIDRDELAAWLRLLLVPGVGRESARRLLAALGSPQAVAAAGDAALAGVVGSRLARQIRTEPQSWPRVLDATQRWLDAAPGRQLVTLGDAAYPPRLLESPDPPLLLFVQGSLACLSAPSIAVVGSRKPSAQGSDNAREFARQLGQAGYVVVSGLALGVDAAAHEGALAGGAPTIAVLGSGIDRIYPQRHADLARRVSAQGALVSEFVPGTPPLAENFPQRNRIIAGLSLGTLVVEAALRSGSLITARLANEAGREVFAVPGSIHAAQSRGCHALIRDGARLVETPADVLDELPPLAARAAQHAPVGDAAPAEHRHGALLEALGHDPVTLDGLQARTGQPTAELLAGLLELELDGRVARLPGGLFQRRARA